MLKIYINNEEVIANQNFTIQKHMLNTPSVILNNVCPKTWCDEKDYITNFYHPLDYSKCKIVDETFHPYDPGITTTINQSATLNNVDTTKLYELTQIEGNTTQNGTPTPTSPQPINVVSGGQEVSVVGKNLFNINETYIKNGTTVSIDNNVLTQTNTSSYSRTMWKISNLVVGQQYTFSYNFTNENSCSIQVRIMDSANSTIKAQSTATTSTTGTTTLTFTATETTQYIRLYSNTYSSSNTYSVVYKNIQLEKGSTASQWEAYKGQSYEINLGKNLLKNTSTSNTDNNYWFIYSTYDEDTGTLTRSTTATSYSPIAHYYNLKNNTTYTVSCLMKSNGYVSGSAIWIYNQGASKTYSKTNLSLTTEYQKYTFTFTTDSTTNFTKSTIRFDNNGSTESGTEAVLTITDVMLVEGTDTDYAPYKTPIELCKINTYKDMIFRGKGVNLFDKSTITEGKYIDGNGNIISDSNNFLGDYIQIDNTKNYYVSGANKNFIIRIGYYDSSQTWISRQLISGARGSLTIPNNAKYVRLSCYNQDLDTIMLNEGTTALPYEPYNSKGKWLLHKEIGKVVLNGSETWTALETGGGGNKRTNTTISTSSSASARGFIYSNYFNYNGSYATDTIGSAFISLSRLYVYPEQQDSTANFKTWLSTHNTIVYYVLATPTTTEITDTELISQLNSIELLEGLNNISITSGDLPGIMTIHYNFKEAYTTEDLLFCGVVKNSGNISLNPRQPHYTTLQVLDFKDFLSSGETLDFVIYQKTILEAIQQVIGTIQDYGFILGNVNILNPNEIIGAYSTKDKTAYDVFNYIADITQSRWTTRMIDENTIAIDFYDPTLMPQGTEIDYTNAYFNDKLIDDMKYSYGTNNYRNKQVMISKQVYSNISQAQTIVANGYQTQFPTEQPIGKINSITSNGVPLTFATFNEKDMGYVADFYYTPGDNYFESDDLRSTGEVLIIDYVAIVEGRQVITNSTEIDRIQESTGRKGIIARYETRNDATTSTELQKIGESYIKYKGTPEIVLTIQSRKNTWEVGQRVQFNAPIDELETEYMVRSKKINYIANQQENESQLFYTYELISSFNSETEINYFDNQRAKTSGNIGEGEYISRNIDIESTAEIIFYDTDTTEVQVSGDNELNAILNSPFIS